MIVDGVEQRSGPSTRPPPKHNILILQAQNYYGFGRLSIPESVMEPRDLLNDDVRAEFIKRNSLDGVCDTPINTTRREEWFSKIKADISQKDIAQKNIDLDPGLEYLCTLVDGITGPGLPYYTDANQIEFLTPTLGLGLHRRDQDYVIVPTWDDTGEREDALQFVWEDWEIAVAFYTGRGPFALCGSCAIYCRHTEDDANKEWKWRYGIFDMEWHSDMYNSVEEFLAFYAHHRVQTEEMLRKRFPSLGKKTIPIRPH
jgi:hypothetical protein